MSESAELTQLIGAAAAGDERARQTLFERAYPELKRLAHNRLYRHGGGDMQTTELLAESFLRYVNAGALRANDRASFFAYASSIMRSVIFDMYRAANAEKRGGEHEITVLSTQLAEQVGVEENRFLELEDAMRRLQEADPRLAQVVDLRYFGGLEWSAVAETLGINERTARRDWDKAQLILRALLE